MALVQPNRLKVKQSGVLDEEPGGADRNPESGLQGPGDPSHRGAEARLGEVKGKYCQGGGGVFLIHPGLRFSLNLFQTLNQ